MENLSGMSGYAASTLVLLTFGAKDMRVLRIVAIFSNLAFITYGTVEWLPPVLFLHLVLLPLNIVRLAEIVRATYATGDLTQADGAVRAQTLGADMIVRGQSPVASWPISSSRIRRASLANPTKRVATNTLEIVGAASKETARFMITSSWCIDGGCHWQHRLLLR